MPLENPTTRTLRHRAEVPMLIIAGLITAVGIGGAVIALINGEKLATWQYLALLGLFIPLFHVLVGVRMMYWQTISNGVEINEEQLPDVYKRYCDLATRMELDPIPRLYLVNGNGVLNAFASRCQLRRNYVVIFSDLLEVAYELNDFSTVDFVLAHELGHIKCGHVAFWRSAIAALPAAVRFTPSMIRAQEYTADRVAMYYAPTGAEGLLVLFAGKRMHRHCDHAAYVKSIRNHKDGFWLKFTNIFSDHAVGFRRYSAIAEAEEKGWDVHGKMI